jgi:threonine/homoserine/homoserine lactone efflux protein
VLDDKGSFLQYPGSWAVYLGPSFLQRRRYVMSLIFSMATFALVASITPGPVNIVALSSGARYGFRATLRHVAGATLGFVLLLVLMGLGLHEVLQRWPGLTRGVQLAGVAFLLFMAWKLAMDDGELGDRDEGRAPSMVYGALMQWLNPKAWLACVAGMGAFVADGETWRVWQFAAIYLVICYLSVGCWAYAGSYLRIWLGNPATMRLFNRAMAALLGASAVYLWLP